MQPADAATLGSALESAMDPERRRAHGVHYTSERDVLRLIRPLLLDGLRAELRACGRSRPALRAFHERLGRLTFLDPACGCGSFLAVAHRELRAVEEETVRRLGGREPRRVSSGQFHGIELDARAARVAGEALGAGARILAGNALRLDWEGVLPAERCSFVLGNPPYAGKHLLTPAQRADLAAVAGTGSLDYAAGWLLKAAEYIARGPDVRGAFVVTNSLTQGEQVPALWPLLHARGLRVTFGWRTFGWTSESRAAAKVHVVIVGFGRAAGRPVLFEEAGDRAVTRTVPGLNGYLAPAPEVYPAARSRPLDPATPPVVYGAKPADGGFLLLDAAGAAAVRESDPVAAAYLRPLLSATEFLNGRERWCLWLVDADPAELRRSPLLRERLAGVRAFRLASPKARTRATARRPERFAEVRRPRGDFVFVPRHASASRRLIPMALVPAAAGAVVHDSGAYVESADLALFGVLQSEMFAAWQRTVGGRIKSDYRFNNRLVYNAFPFPRLTGAERERIAAAAAGVLTARAAHRGASLADLYGPAATPDLDRAHERLDAAVDAAFGHARNADRLGTLLGRYRAAHGS